MRADIAAGSEGCQQLASTPVKVVSQLGHCSRNSGGHVAIAPRHSRFTCRITWSNGLSHRRIALLLGLLVCSRASQVTAQ